MSMNNLNKKTIIRMDLITLILYLIKDYKKQVLNRIREKITKQFNTNQQYM